MAQHRNNPQYEKLNAKGSEPAHPDTGFRDICKRVGGQRVVGVVREERYTTVPFKDSKQAKKKKTIRIRVPGRWVPVSVTSTANVRDKLSGIEEYKKDDGFAGRGQTLAPGKKASPQFLR